MKFYKILTTLSFLIILTNAQAQILEDLKAPTMPAATMIGTQVNEISKPKSLKSLEAAVLNNYMDSAGSVIIPNNYAIEINPFLLSKRKNFKYEEYLKNTPEQTLWRNLSFSVASTNSFSLNDTLAVNALGFGGRTILVEGKINEELTELYNISLQEMKVYKELESKLKASINYFLKDTTSFDLQKLKSFLIQEYPQETEIINKIFDPELLPVTTNRDNIIVVFLKIFKDEFTKESISNFRKLLENVKKERYGLIWEIDAAMALTFPTNDFTYSICPKYGIWSNLSYRPYKTTKNNLKIPGTFEFIGMLRWISNNDDFINTFHQTDSTSINPGNILDIGIRAVLEIKKFSAEFEYIFRMNQNHEYITVNGLEYSRTNNDNTDKFVFNFNYNITDNIVLSYNIGKNYDFAYREFGTLISGFTLNFGFGSLDKEEVLKADQ